MLKHKYEYIFFLGLLLIFVFVRIPTLEKSYFFLFQFLSLYTLGGMLILVLSKIFSAGWAQIIDRFEKYFSSVIGMWFFSFLPLIFFYREFFEIPSQLSSHKEIWYNSFFLTGRGLFYLFSLPLLYGIRNKTPIFSFISIFIVALFFSFDFSMPVDFHWYSSIYPLLYLSNGILLFYASLYFGLEGLGSPIAERDRINLGNLFLTFVFFNGYMHFSQFLIIWIGNVPNEVHWYIERTGEGKTFFNLGWALIKFVLVLPALFFQSLKTRLSLMKKVSAILILATLMDITYLFIPVAQKNILAVFIVALLLTAVFSICRYFDRRVHPC